MSPKISCPNCQASYRLRDDLLGKKLKCAKCQKAFIAKAPIEVVPIDVQPLNANVVNAEIVAVEVVDVELVDSTPKPPKQRNSIDKMEKASPAVTPAKSSLFDDPLFAETHLFANTPAFADTAATTPQPTSPMNAASPPAEANYWEQIGMASMAPAPAPAPAQTKTKTQPIPVEPDGEDTSYSRLAYNGFFLVTLAFVILLLGAFGYELRIRRLKLSIPTAMYLPLGWLGCLLIFFGFRTIDFRLGLRVSCIAAFLLPAAGIVAMLAIGDPTVARERRRIAAGIRHHAPPTLPNPASIPHHAMGSSDVGPATLGPIGPIAPHLPETTDPEPEREIRVEPPERFADRPELPSLQDIAPQFNREGLQNQPTMPGEFFSGQSNHLRSGNDDPERMPTPPRRAARLDDLSDLAAVRSWQHRLIMSMAESGVPYVASQRDPLWSQPIGQPTFPRWKSFLSVEGIPATGMIANFRLGQSRLSEILPVFPDHGFESTTSPHSFAPEGYVIGGVDVVINNRAITCIRPIYCPVKENGNLDSNEQVQGEWIGKGPFEKYSTITPTQKAVIGFAVSIDSSAFCLIYR